MQNYFSLRPPLRTVAFTNHRNWVLFTTGMRDSSALCLVGAAAATPAVMEVPIKPAGGLSLVTPETVIAASGKRDAFVVKTKRKEM